MYLRYVKTLLSVINSMKRALLGQKGNVELDGMNALAFSRS